MSDASGKARIELTAIDSASAVLALVKGKADDLTKSADSIKSAWSAGLLDSFTKGPALAVVGIMGGIAAGATAAGAYLVKLGLDAASSQAGLKGMAETTGATVEGLSSLRTIAKLGGTDMESLAGAFTKLAKNVTTGGDDVKRGLTAIGLSQKELQGLSTDQMFLKITKALDGYRDGAEKTALAQVLMGKSGAAMLPVMKDIAEAGDLVVKTTLRQAIEADDLEKNIKRLTMAKEAWKKVVGSELVPVLGDVVQVLLKLQTETNGTLKTAKDLAADGSIRKWAESGVIGVAYLIDIVQGAWGAFKAFGAGIAGLLAGSTTVLGGLAESSVAIIKGEYGKLPGIVRGASAGIVEITKAVGADIGKNLFPDQLLSDRFKKQFADSAQSAKDFAENMRYTGDTSKKAIVGIGEKAKETEPKVNALGKALDDLFNKLNNSGGDDALLKQQALLAKALQSGAIGWGKYADGMSKAFLQSKTFTDGNKEIADSLKVNEDLLNKNRQAVEDAAQAMVLGNTELTNEIAGLGKTRLERELYNLSLQKTSALRRIDATLTGDEHDLRVKEVDDLYAAREAMLTQRDAIEQNQAAWGSLGATTEAFFSDLFQHGASAFGNLWSTIKKFFADVAAKFATRFVLNAIFGASGGGGGGDFLSSLFGGGSGSGGGGSAGGLSALSLKSLLPESLTSALSSLALPAMVAMAGAALGKALSGGFEIFKGSGEIIGALFGGVVSGILNRVFGHKDGFKIDNSTVGIGNPASHFTPSALGAFDYSGRGVNNSDFAPLTKKINALDSYIATNLLGPDLLAKVKANIQNLHNSPSWNNLDKAGVEAGTSAFLKQRYSTVFESIDTSVAEMIRTFDGSSDELIAFIDKLSQSAYVVKKVNDEVPGMNLSIKAFIGMSDAAKQAFTQLAYSLSLFDTDTAASVDALIKQSAAGVIGAYNSQVEAVLLLKKGLASGTTSIEQFAAGVGNVATAYAAATAKLAEIKAALAGLFSDSRDVFLTGGMSNEEKYAYLQKQAAADYELLTKATSIEEIDRLTRKIDANQRAAFSLLTPEQQRAASGEFVDANRRVEQTSTDRLTTAGNAMDKQNAAIKTAIKEGLAEYAAAAKEAADKQLAAANTQQGAANTRREVDIIFTANIPGQLQTTEVGG